MQPIVSETYPAVVATEPDTSATIRELSDDDLPEGDVTVDVAWSDLNYKDGLAVTGRGKVIRRFPMVCGIDLAGVVRESHATQWQTGDEVLVTGWGLSETHPGGFTHRQRVRSQWVMARPPDLSLRQTMAVGTAGLTAMLAVLALEHNGLEPRPDGGEVLVTGAGGGVGSMAITILDRLGYRVAASTGRPENHEYLRSLGATTIIERAELARPAQRHLESERWAGAVDTVGGETLATVLRQTGYRGPVAACGLAGSSELPTTVLPFILRGVRLIGIESVMCPTPLRAKAWHRLARDVDIEILDKMTTVQPMTNIAELADAILAGQTRGRVVIDVHS
jgi:acrylyl-CoA reductase (NADPH)